MENIQNLLSKIRRHVELDNKQKEEARKRGEHFNVFSVLRMETAEMETHSAFLASLLNPDGDHGMKNAFLESFIAKTGCADLNLVTERCIVQVEHFTGDGRIDILIADNLEHKAIVIENKIYASDQDAQLKRYHNYATANYKEGFRLLYLTLDGDDPSDDSRKGLSDTDFYCISYRNDILPWLEQCAREAYNKPLVRETINQYISLIKNLTGMNSEDNIKNAIVDLMANQENFQTAALVASNFQEIKKQIVYTVFKPQLEDKLKELPECTLSHFDYGEGAYSSIGIEVEYWHNALIVFEFDKYGGTDGLVYGINWPAGRPQDIKLSNYRHNGNWLWKNFPEPYYWWNSDTFEDIFNGKVADAFILRIKELLEIVKQQKLEL